MISAKLIAASISPSGDKITTIQVRQPKFLLAEFNTHRAFSRSSGSSRAIPIKHVLEQVREAPFYPVYWGAHRAGMQATEELSPELVEEAEAEWSLAAYEVCERAEELLELGLHKQVVNRLLEPFMYVDTVVTATEWDNFLELRDHPDAQPEFQVLAKAMRKVLEEAEYEEKGWGEWHLPYVTKEEVITYGVNLAAQLSTARCARVSYHKHDGTDPSVEEDLFLFERLMGSEPLHASPAEHQAIASVLTRSRNFYGWLQHRELLEE